MRLFLAIDPGRDCRRRIATLVDELRGGTTRIRWVPEDNLHITLAFLGEVAEQQVPSVDAAARDLAARHAAFHSRLDTGGVFPDWRRPRVVWLGPRDRDPLHRLGNDIHALCADLGFPPDHPFRGHLTIGRATDRLADHERQSLRARLDHPGTHPFDVVRVVLIRSVLGRTGSVYSELASFPLGGT